MKNLKRLIILSIFTIFASLNSFTQCYFVDPPDPDPPTYDCASSNGFILPASGTIRVLVVFAEIDYNSPLGEDDPNPNSTEFWTIHQLPDWKDNIFDPFTPSSEPAGYITKYYQQASSSNLIVLGDYLTIPNTGGIFSVLESEILDENGNYTKYIPALCDEIDASLNGNFNTQNNLNDVSYFDNWTVNRKFEEKVTPSEDHPPEIDQVMIFWRNRVDFDGVGSGYCSSGYSLLGYAADSWTEVGAYNHFPDKTTRHEYAHWILGHNAFHTYKDDVGYWAAYVGGWGALSLYDASFLCWSSWDRMRLGWFNSGNQYNPSARNSDNTAEVDGDLDATILSDAGIYYLRDFITNGDAIRIKLPNPDLENDFQQWLWIENHNGENINSNEFDQFQYEENNQCIQPCIPGLYMYLQIDRNTLEGNFSEVISGYRDYMRPVTAEGFYDRLYSVEVQNQCVSTDHYEPFTINPELENPFTGGGDQDCYPIDKYPDNHILVKEGNINFIEKIGNNYYHELYAFGHSRHAFTLSGKNKIGIGTNPSTATMLSFLSFDSPEDDEQKNVRKIYLNGVSVEILDQDASGGILVDVNFDDVDVVEDRRWCADSIVLSPPPHNADYSLNITDSANTKLDWSMTATRIDVPKIYNDDKYFSDPTMFVCLPASILHIDTGSSMELVNISTLQLMDDAILEIETGAKLIIRQGSNFVARTGSEILIKGNGKIEVEAGAYICIEDNVTVTLQDANSSIVLNEGFYEGVNPYIEVLPATNCDNICQLQPQGNGSFVHATDFPNNEIIDYNLTWDNQSLSFGADLIIESPWILTIQNESLLLFGENSKIIIEEGAKLVLDNSTLSSLNNCFWDENSWAGIEVRGNPNATQIPSNQGWLIVTDGSKIENAEVAVRVGSDEYTGKGGGLIFAYDTEFLNNGICVWFDPYSYIADNMSYFTTCTFKYSKTISGEGTFVLVKLDDVHRIDFTECSFSNSTNQNYTGTGIESFNSIFTVDGIYSETSWHHSEFNDLHYGIYATSSNTNDFCDVRHSFFNDVFRGIYIAGMTSPRITSNAFSLNTTLSEGGYGLYLDASTRYWVEDNYFSMYETPHTGVGIIVNESGGDPNEIYLNEFYGLEYSINVQGENRNSINPAQGLVLKCNNYINTQFDETIIWDGLKLPKGEGIAGDQGTPSLAIDDMAGNIFHYETTSTDFDDLNNEANHFDYYYSTNSYDPNVEPEDYTSFTVQPLGQPTTLEWSFEEACESGINTGGGGIEEERSEMSSAQTGIETSEALLTDLVDGGDTEILKTEVENSTPPEAVEVYTELLSESPNLSETVIESTIEQETVLPNAMVRDVMVANPHSAKSFVLIDKLDDRFDPMPDYMKAQILAGRSIQTMKQELESQLAGFKIRKTKAMNAIVRYFNEELGDQQAASDSIMVLYQEDNSLKSSYLLAWLYFSRGEYESGEEMLDNIPGQFLLGEADQQKHSNMLNIYTILSDLYSNGNPVDSLSESQVNELQVLALEGAIPAMAYARNILMSIGEMDYQEPVLFPNPFKSSEAMGEYNELLNTKAPQLLSIYPNPSSGYVIIEYNLESDADGIIEIKDVTGRTVTSISTYGKQDQVTIITENWDLGIYFTTLRIDGNSIESHKFTLVK